MLKSLKTNFSTQNVEACEKPQQIIFFAPAHLYTHEQVQRKYTYLFLFYNNVAANLT